MNFVQKNLANAFTLGNLLSGSIGIIHLIKGNYEVTAVCIIISLILDFLDGFVARAMKTDSNLGAQLDSLADMLTFGLLPGITMYKALEPFGYQFLNFTLPFEISYFGLFIALFSCLRLAIFNLDDEQTYYFKGLNTPSNTILIFGLYFAFMETSAFQFLFSNENLLVLSIVISSWLLISPIKMIAFKFKSMKLQDNIPKIVLLVGAIIIFLIFKKMGIPLIIIYYMFISIIFQKQLKNN
ncbi:CDP-alcohol phosphatidyltransferase family protein [Frigoriflavimonas asaccharolytica]|uniref:CDP-diacylglycerol--serine O-phosphatidyltransferase n=1 Tax=Frigoriflavimonas asaccharolytica TaxID=2735899 RepID=A0A8J8G5B1_9FLAO|nr:CDP-alcohol phosphatidyltransferase family protein [Frigoriflavimonas asaccharolytica]NRS91418.1 CDP-diacylglycerol--serine O-phosphatidyltransferase [Frigoriflavimonas asaccharolytica]